MEYGTCSHSTLKEASNSAQNSSTQPLTPCCPSLHGQRLKPTFSFPVSEEQDNTSEMPKLATTSEPAWVTFLNNTVCVCVHGVQA